MGRYKKFWVKKWWEMGKKESLPISEEAANVWIYQANLVGTTGFKTATTWTPPHKIEIRDPA